MAMHVLLVLFFLASSILAKPILPIRVQGAAGDGSKAALASAGAISFRTLDVDE